MVGRLGRLVPRGSTGGSAADSAHTTPPISSPLLGPGSFVDAACPCWAWGATCPTARCACATTSDHPEVDSTRTTRVRRPTSTPDRALEAIAHALGAEFAINPSFWMRRVVTVHPLGGIPMATSERDGVVDSVGRVRGVEGMRVCDGSVFPGPVGANPSLTIAAFADRVADDLLTEVTP